MAEMAMTAADTIIAAATVTAAATETAAARVTAVATATGARSSEEREVLGAAVRKFGRAWEAVEEGRDGVLRGLSRRRAQLV